MKTTSLVLAVLFASTNATHIKQSLVAQLKQLAQIKSHEDGPAVENGVSNGVAVQVEGPAQGQCQCGEGEFCNNDGGENVGFCEPCMSSAAECAGSGLPELGVAACNSACASMFTPALAQIKSQQELCPPGWENCNGVEEGADAVPEGLEGADAVPEGGPEDGPAIGPCQCGEGEFCNNDGGENVGFCEPCLKSAAACADDGLPELGVAACKSACASMFTPALAQTKASDNVICEGNPCETAEEVCMVMKRPDGSIGDERCNPSITECEELRKVLATEEPGNSFECRA